MIKTIIKSYCLFFFCLTVVNLLWFSHNLSFQKRNGNWILKSISTNDPPLSLPNSTSPFLSNHLYVLYKNY